MKRKSLCFLLSAATLLISLAGCKKETQPDPAALPVPTGPASPSPQDTNKNNIQFQKERDIAAAIEIISDIDMACSFLGENILINNFYIEIPGTASSNTGSFVTIRDATAKYAVMSWNQTSCLDGRQRNGSLLMRYDASTSGAAYYREYGYLGRVATSNYRVDDWVVELFDPTVHADISNKLPSAVFNSAQTNLSWEIAGKFKMTNQTHPQRIIIWDGKLIKTLVNTADTNAYKPSGIQWKKSVVQYTGAFTSTVSGISFTCQIDAANPLLRDLSSCSYVPPGSSGVTEMHPIIAGSIKVMKNDTAIVNFGPSQACDRVGEIKYKNNPYTVTFP